MSDDKPPDDAFKRLMENIPDGPSRWVIHRALLDNPGILDYLSDEVVARIAALPPTDAEKEIKELALACRPQVSSAPRPPAPLTHSSFVITAPRFESPSVEFLYEDRFPETDRANMKLAILDAVRRGMDPIAGIGHVLRAYVAVALALGTQGIWSFNECELEIRRILRFLASSQGLVQGIYSVPRAEVRAALESMPEYLAFLQEFAQKAGRPPALPLLTQNKLRLMWGQLKADEGFNCDLQDWVRERRQRFQMRDFKAVGISETLTLGYKRYKQISEEEEVFEYRVRAVATLPSDDYWSRDENWEQAIAAQVEDELEEMWRYRGYWFEHMCRPVLRSTFEELRKEISSLVLDTAGGLIDILEAKRQLALPREQPQVNLPGNALLTPGLRKPAASADTLVPEQAGGTEQPQQDPAMLTPTGEPAADSTPVPPTPSEPSPAKAPPNVENGAVPAEEPTPPEIPGPRPRAPRSVRMNGPFLKALRTNSGFSSGEAFVEKLGNRVRKTTYYKAEQSKRIDESQALVLVEELNAYLGSGDFKELNVYLGSKDLKFPFTLKDVTLPDSEFPTFPR
jgi:hypothetical protein